MRMIDDSGKEYDVAYLDGYSIAERLLEGVRFEVRNQNGQLVCEGVHPDDADYMIQFSEKQRAEWNMRAVEAAMDDTPLFTSDETEVWVDA